MIDVVSDAFQAIGGAPSKKIVDRKEKEIDSGTDTFEYGDIIMRAASPEDEESLSKFLDSIQDVDLCQSCRKTPKAHTVGNSLFCTECDTLRHNFEDIVQHAPHADVESLATIKNILSIPEKHKRMEKLRASKYETGKRNIVLKLYGKRCFMCGYTRDEIHIVPIKFMTRYNIEVHHIIYPYIYNLGKERIEDYAILCSECHDDCTAIRNKTISDGDIDKRALHLQQLSEARGTKNEED